MSAFAVERGVTIALASKSLLQQRGRFDHFVESYNANARIKRCGTKYPAELSRPLPRPTRVDYPFHDRTVAIYPV
jgi:hypothetical protein